MNMISALKLVPAAMVKEVLKFPSLLIAVEKGLANFSNRMESGIDQPVRSVVMVPPSNGFLGCMPVYSRADDVLATKLVTFFPQNKGVSTHNAVVMVFDTSTGVPKALLDGEVITAMRTAAASAVATKYLVNGEPKLLAILGSGVQARSHYEALSEIFNFQQVRIWNHRPEGAGKFAAELGGNCLACTTVEETVADADVIVTVTSSSKPVLKKEWVKTGVHINAVGACRPDWAEIEPDLMRSAVVYADSSEAAVKESGDIIMSKVDVYSEIGEVINGKKEARRDQTTVFKSLGIAIEDAVAAKLVLEKLGM